MLSENGSSSITYKLTMGMKYWWTPCAIFMVRPCFTHGIKIITSQTLYATGSMDVKLRMLTKYGIMYTTSFV